jgi:hypothetical protein
MSNFLLCWSSLPFEFEVGRIAAQFGLGSGDQKAAGGPFDCDELLLGTAEFDDAGYLAVKQVVDSAGYVGENIDFGHCCLQIIERPQAVLFLQRHFLLQLLEVQEVES